MYGQARRRDVRPPHIAEKAAVARTDAFDYAAVLRTMHAIVKADGVRGGWRRVAEVIGYGDAAMWCRAAKGGPLSRRAENELRLLMGIAPKGQPDIDRWTPRTVRRYMAGRRSYTS